MSTITVRFFHHPSRTPITELQGVDPSATLSSLRAKVEQHLAAEEACMMRVFARCYVEITAAGRKRVVELTAQDEAASLSSLGIEDYSEVLLEGPLTHTVEGVGQGLALVGAQMRRLEEQNAEVKSILLRITEGISGISAGMSELIDEQRHNHRKAALPDNEHLERLSLRAEEQHTFDMLSLHKAALVGCLVLGGEEMKARGKLSATAISECQRFLPCFSIDTTTPQAGVRLEGPHTAVKRVDGWVTLRSSRALSAANHRWAVRVRGIDDVSIELGLLPQLPANKEAKMASNVIGGLGGWSIYQKDIYSSVCGDWQCKTLYFGNGDLVLFDYSFTEKTLTIRCGGKQVVGRIPKMKEGEELYPAFSFRHEGAKVSFEKYIE